MAGDYKVQKCVFCKKYTHERPECDKAPACHICGKKGHAPFFCPLKSRKRADASSVRNGKKAVPGGNNSAPRASGTQDADSPNAASSSRRDAGSVERLESEYPDLQATGEALSESDEAFTPVARPLRTRSRSGSDSGLTSPPSPKTGDASQRRSSTSGNVASANRYALLADSNAGEVDPAKKAADDKEAEEVDELASSAEAEENAASTATDSQSTSASKTAAAVSKPSASTKEVVSEALSKLVKKPAEKPRLAATPLLRGAAPVKKAPVTALSSSSNAASSSRAGKASSSQTGLPPRTRGATSSS